MNKRHQKKEIKPYIMPLIMIGLIGGIISHFIINDILKGIFLIVCFCLLWGGIFTIISYTYNQGTLTIPKKSKRPLYFMCAVNFFNIINTIVEINIIKNSITIVTVVMVVYCVVLWTKGIRSLRQLD